MIHGNSIDPVNIKKIDLNIWKLRDEIEALVREELSTDENFQETPPEQLAQSDEQKEEEQNGVKQAIPLLKRPPIEKEKLYFGKTILAEISIEKIFLFSSQEFLHGQSIVIEFLVPNHFIINAEVVYCKPHNMKSRIIGEKKLPYRVGARFTFIKEGERTNLRKFLQSIEPDKPKESAKKQSSNKSEDSTNEFEELDDL